MSLTHSNQLSLQLAKLDKAYPGLGFRDSWKLESEWAIEQFEAFRSNPDLRENISVIEELGKRLGNISFEQIIKICLAAEKLEQIKWGFDPEVYAFLGGTVKHIRETLSMFSDQSRRVSSWATGFGRWVQKLGNFNQSLKIRWGKYNSAIGGKGERARLNLESKIGFDKPEELVNKEVISAISFIPSSYPHTQKEITHTLLNLGWSKDMGLSEFKSWFKDVYNLDQPHEVPTALWAAVQQVISSAYRTGDFLQWSNEEGIKRTKFWTNLYMDFENEGLT
jgi:hypothetical protein